MIKIFNEQEVTSKTLAKYMTDAGIQWFIDAYTDIGPDSIYAELDTGNTYIIKFFKAEKYIKIFMCFCDDEKRTARLRRTLKQLVNIDPVFFSIYENDDESTLIQCGISYDHGLLPHQFISLLNRFHSFVQYIDLCILGRVASPVSA